MICLGERYVKVMNLFGRTICKIMSLSLFGERYVKLWICLGERYVNL